MDDGKVRFLWSQLQHTEGPIPWPALDEFANIFVEEPEIWKGLAKRYNEIALSCEDYFSYEQLYIPAIFAKAAPRLSKETILEISPFLVEKLCEAGFDDDDLLLEVFSAACGSMGPVILPTVLDFIVKEKDTFGAWVFLWGLLKLADRADEHLRQRVIDFCVKFLEQADKGEISLSDAESAADVLSHLGCREYLELVKRLEKKSKRTFYYSEYKSAVRILEGSKSPSDFTELWEEPVEEWLTCRWELCKDWHEKNKNEEVDVGEEFDFQRYKANKLTWRFLKSADASELLGGSYEDADFIISDLLDYALTYEDAGPEELDERVLKEVLLTLFPRKLTADRELFEKIAPVTAAFLVWLEKQQILPNGSKMAHKVRDLSGQIVTNSMDSKCWGMGKTLMMRAKADSVDIYDRTALQRYITEYNRNCPSETDFPESVPADLSLNEPPIPIADLPPKIGRNEPCPCGSGKKYKKCCGKAAITDSDMLGQAP